MVKGRKPIPSALSRLHGCPGKRRLPDGEPQPRIPTSYPAPAYLRPEAREQWETITDQLCALAMITELDLNLVAAWCSVSADYQIAERNLEREGLVVASPDRGLVRSPWVL